VGVKPSKEKNIKSSPYDEMEKILIEWFEAMCSFFPINGVLLKEKAVRVVTRLRIENFKGSNGWLDRFKQCHGLEYKRVCGESASVEEGTVDYWKSVTLVRYLEGYKLNDILMQMKLAFFPTFFHQKLLLLEETSAMVERKVKIG
jgi:hypothetical protein